MILASIKEAVRAVSPDKVLQNEIRFKNPFLTFARLHKIYDFSEYDKVMVVGGGKASGSLSQSLEEIIGPDLITSGLVNILQGTKHLFRTRKIQLNEASHPVPNRAGVEGVKKMIDLLEGATPRSLVFCLISGGGSSLLPLPAEGITLEQKIKTTDLLLKAGATIDQINCVRKHISLIKGGQLPRYANGAQIVSLIVSDVVGDHLESIASGPTAPDPTTYSDALRILGAFHIMRRVPLSVRKRLIDGSDGKKPETPKPGDRIFSQVSNIILASNRYACEAAVRCLKERLGPEAQVEYLGSSWQGEASVIARDLAEMFCDFSRAGSLKETTRCEVWGGETTVTVTGNGSGGRNQEQALATLKVLSKPDCQIVLAFFGTDGVDGRTDSAGALVDSKTYERARRKGLDPNPYLRSHDSNTFFKKLEGALIQTGPTGTNVNDIGVAIISRRRHDH